MKNVREKRKQQAKVKNATVLEHAKATFSFSFSSSDSDHSDIELDGAEHETQFESIQEQIQERKHAQPQCKLPI